MNRIKNFVCDYGTPIVAGACAILLAAVVAPHLVEWQKKEMEIAMQGLREYNAQQS